MSSEKLTAYYDQIHELTQFFNQYLDKDGMLDYPTPEREHFKREIENDRKRYVVLVLRELEDCESYDEFAANVDTLFSFEHDEDQGTNDFIEGVVENFEDIPNYKEVKKTQEHYSNIAIGAIELFKDRF